MSPLPPPRDRCIRLPAAGAQPPRAISTPATASLISADAYGPGCVDRAGGVARRSSRSGQRPLNKIRLPCRRIHRPHRAAALRNLRTYFDSGLCVFCDGFHWVGPTPGLSTLTNRDLLRSWHPDSNDESVAATHATGASVCRQPEPSLRARFHQPPPPRSSRQMHTVVVASSASLLLHTALRAPVNDRCTKYGCLADGSTGRIARRPSAICPRRV